LKDNKSKIVKRKMIKKGRKEVDVVIQIKGKDGNLVTYNEEETKEDLSDS
jgi:hypothetical protein